MTVKELNPADLCRRLADGWSENCPEIPRELLARLCARWHATADGEWTGRSAWRTVLELNHVRLQGASEVGCLVLGNGADMAREVPAFWEKLGGAGRLGLVLAATPSLAEAARTSMVSQRCVFLCNGEIEAMLTHPHSLEQLKQHLRAQIPRRTLLPYDITHPVLPNMFFGRRDFIDRFHHEETTNFAVAGPGRIGKSSLLRQYVYELKKRRDERCRRLKLIDCYAYTRLGADSFARQIAMDLSANSMANRVTQESLLRFLKWHSHDGRQPAELLFDEVDLVCHNAAFQNLAEAVKEGYCRVILCGKGVLHKMMRSKDTPLAARLEFLQPDPLDGASAERLLLEPLADAGFVVADPTGLRDAVCELTRRMPHLIQACAKQLVEIALSETTDIITLDHFRRVCEEFTPTLYGNLPLDSLQDDLTRLIALLLLRSGCGVVTVGRLQQLAEKEGVALSAQKTIDICYDLWICNILTRNRGTFTLANPILVDFVHKLGMLPGEIARLLRVVPHASSRRLSAAI